MKVYLVCMYKEEDYLPFSVDSLIYEILYASTDYFSAHAFRLGYERNKNHNDGFIVRVIACVEDAFYEYDIIKANKNGDV